ncbi:hypothetical protein pb186bvf_009265 [Paramecium bursaria]
MLDENIDFVFKFVIIGDSNVGKSSILNRLLEDQFKTNHETTLGVDLGIKILKVDNSNVKIRIWDTAGQEQFQSITCSYYRGAIGILLVYDIGCRKSFESIQRWHQMVIQYANPKISIALIANKADLEDKQVEQFEAQQLAQQLNAVYIETSALSGQNIEFVFTKLCKQIIQLVNNKEIDLTNKNNGVQVITRQKTSCC